MTKGSMIKEENKKKFFQDALNAHGNYYDYSKVVLKGVTEKIIIICPKHGEFHQELRSHLKGRGCQECGFEKINSTKIEKSKIKFFEEAPKIHKKYYDYSKCLFQGVTIKVVIVCPKHGEFQQKPCKHLKGQGCNKCGEERTANGQRKTKDEFIKQSKEKHGDHYNYDAVEYINDNTPIKIYCNIHKKHFQQTPGAHLIGHGCNDCGIEIRSKLKIEIASAKFWEKANQDKQLDFSKFTYIKNHEKSIVTCKKCTSDFMISPGNYSAGKGCPYCKKKTEVKLYDLLKDKYSIQRQLKYEWCKSEKNNYLPFDFSIEEWKIIIELDGIQHFETVKHFRNTPEQQHQIDLYKQKCANENGYAVIRIYQEDVCYDTYDWLSQLCKTIDSIKGTVENMYISKRDEYKNFDQVSTFEPPPIQEKYCEVCKINIKYRFKQHENTQKHKDNLLNLQPDSSKYLCIPCNKYVSDKRKHYNSENHKTKMTPTEWEKQMKELDSELSCKKKVHQYDMENKLLNTFDSVNDAYRHLNKTYGGSIGKCCNGDKKSCLGFIWKWVNL